METYRTDAELVADWRQGDTAALGAVYDRYGPAIHGFALARTRSAADAADVVQDTFVRAASRVHQLREPERLRAWLFAIARRRVFDLAGRREVVTGRDVGADVPADDLPVETTVVRDEVRELVWTAAGSLTDRDRELLELHLRDGLEGADLAAVVGLAPAHVHTLVNRLKDRMAKAVGALLVARHARRSCPVLDGLLGGWDGRFTLDVRSRVTRHVESCSTCTAERGVLVMPGWFSAGAFALPALVPADLRSRVLDAVATHGHPFGPPGGTSGEPGRSWRADGFPRVPRRFRHRRPVAAGPIALGAIAGVALVVAVGFGIVMRSGEEARSSVVASPSTAAPAPGLPSPVADDGAPPATANTVTTAPVPAAATTTLAAPPQSATAKTAPGPDVARDAVPPTAPPGGVLPGGTSAGDGAAPASTTAAQPSGTVAPAVSPPPVTTSPAPATTSGTSGDATTTAPPAPAALVLSTSSIALGAGGTTASLSVTNQGGQSATLTSTTSSAELTVSNGGATVAPGSSATLTITLDRGAAAEGERTYTVSVGAPGATGGGQVVVTAAVDRAPIITSIGRTPSTIRTSTSCGQTLTRVSVDATDESGVASVSVLWSSDGVFAQRTALSLDSSGHWTAQVGSFSATGTRSLTVEVTDTRGNHSSGSTTVVVVAC